MSWLKLSDIAVMCGGRLVGADAAVDSVSTDSRQLRAGQLFVALRGPNFDAHEFVAAGSLPAAGALVSRVQQTSLPQIVVDDTQQALTRFAFEWRSRMPARVIGLTGSNGKTTVKEMCASILRQTAKVWATRGNLNNHIGVPLTLLNIRPEHDVAVVEMGANHPGEIAALTRLARPDIACITNAGPAHLEGFGSLEGVARAKGELFAGLDDVGVAVINADDDFADYWRSVAGPRRQHWFGFQSALDVSGEFTPPASLRVITDHGETEVELGLPGRHNAQNALAAAALCHALGAGSANIPGDIKAGLENLRPVKGRLQARRGALGASILDDSYNANPGSLTAALEVLATNPGEHWLVLGDMGELGADSERLHEQAGAEARSTGVERLFATGVLTRHAVAAFGAQANHYPDREALLHGLRAALRPGVCVLIKGSRAMRMEMLVEALLEEAALNDVAWDNDNAA